MFKLPLSKVKQCTEIVTSEFNTNYTSIQKNKTSRKRFQTSLCCYKIHAKLSWLKRDKLHFLFNTFSHIHYISFYEYSILFRSVLFRSICYSGISLPNDVILSYYVSLSYYGINSCLAKQGFSKRLQFCFLYNKHQILSCLSV